MINLDDVPGVVGLNIHYILDELEASFLVKLYCNENMSRSSNVEFYLERIEGMDISFFGYSYFGKIKRYFGGI